nr:hypothetical protein [Aneurinibacillus sp. XH2]
MRQKFVPACLVLFPHRPDADRLPGIGFRQIRLRIRQRNCSIDPANGDLYGQAPGQYRLHVYSVIEI